MTRALYEDIRAVLDTILARGEPGRMVFPSRAEATVWRSRAHKFRKSERRIDEVRHGLIPGEGESVYDSLILRQQENEVLIEFRAHTGTLIIGDDASPLVDFSEFKTPEDE